MGIFVPKPHLERRERLLYKRAANRSFGNRAIGGRLFVTTRRVIFAPNVFDRLLRAKVWSCPITAVESVGTSGRTLEDPLSGGARRRLRLSLSGNQQELFVVNNVVTVVEAIKDAMRTVSADVQELEDIDDRD
jgi:hypothetical protein